MERSPVCIPNSELDTHKSSPLLSFSLAPIDFVIEFCRVGFVVDHATVYLDPSVRFERQALHSDNHLCSHAMFLEEARRCSGTLKTERLLPVPNACHVYC